MTNRLLFHDWLARTLSRLGKTEEALAEADQAIQVADENNVLGCRLLHATILAWANQSDRAVKECQNLLKDAFKPEDVHRIHSALSGIYSTAHENDKAEEQLRRIIADFPDDATAHNDLGYMIADQGNDLPEAENLIRRAIELDRRQKHQEADVGPDDDQDHAAFVDSLGWVLFRRGKLTEALHELQRASTLPEGDDPVIWDHLGDVHFRLGDQAKARESWSKAISLYDKKKRRKRDDQYQELKRKLKLLNKE
jgi:tetratricopeptide (TPR) repeat protein